MSTLRKDSKSFHHGDLHDALIVAGIKQVDRHGLNSLGLRQLALASGVSASAVYRHFRDLEHLKAEISRASRQILGEAMHKKVQAVKSLNPKTLAVKKLLMAGTAYIEFGISKPNLFEIAFVTFDSPQLELEEPSPWEILMECINELNALGVLHSDLLKEAPMIAWSAVHGFAGLSSQGLTGNQAEVRKSTATVLNSVLRSLGISKDTYLSE